MLSKIGTGELIIIILVALFVVGPERLPKLAKSFGKAVSSFKRYMNDMTEELRESDADFKEVSDELKKASKDISDTFKDAGSVVEKAVRDAEEAADASGKAKGTDAGQAVSPSTPETNEAVCEKKAD